MYTVTDTGKQVITIGRKIILAELTVATPAVAFFKNRFWIAWVGLGNQQLNIIGLDRQMDGSWTVNHGTKQTLASTSDRAPALASFNGRLYMAFTGVDNHQLNIVSSQNGNDFQHDSKVTLLSSSDEGPSLAVLNNKLWIGWTGVNGGDYSVMSSSDGRNFDLGTKHSLRINDAVHVGAICEYQNQLNVVVSNVAGLPDQDINSILIYRWNGSGPFPAAPTVILPERGAGFRCAAHGNDLWITSLFNTGRRTGGSDADPIYDEYFWYVYRVVNDDIQGAASFATEHASGWAPLAISHAGEVALAWRGTDEPSHVNMGILPYVTGN